MAFAPQQHVFHMGICPIPQPSILLAAQDSRRDPRLRAGFRGISGRFTSNKGWDSDSSYVCVCIYIYKYINNI